MSENLPELPSDVYEHMKDYLDLQSFSALNQVSKSFNTNTRPTLQRERKKTMEKLNNMFLEPILHPSKWWNFAQYLNIKYGYEITEENIIYEITQLPFEVYINLSLVYVETYFYMTTFDRLEGKPNTDAENIQVENTLQGGLRAFDNYMRGSITYPKYKTPIRFYFRLNLFINRDECPDYRLILRGLIPKMFKNSLIEVISFVQENTEYGRSKEIGYESNKKEFLMEILNYYREKYPSPLNPYL